MEFKCFQHPRCFYGPRMTWCNIWNRHGIDIKEVVFSVSRALSNVHSQSPELHLYRNIYIYTYIYICIFRYALAAIIDAHEISQNNKTWNTIGHSSVIVWPYKVTFWNVPDVFAVAIQNCFLFRTFWNVKWRHWSVKNSNCQTNTCFFNVWCLLVPSQWQS